MKRTGFIPFILSGISLASFVLSSTLFPYTSNLGMSGWTSSYLLVLALGTILAAFVIIIKNGSYIIGTILGIMGALFIYGGYGSLMILQRPEIIGSGEFAQTYTTSIVIGFIMVAMGVFVIVKKTSCSAHAIEKSVNRGDPR